MASKPSAKAEAWAIFDYIVDCAAPKGVHTNPWILNASAELVYQPDYRVLEQLLGVPLHLKAGTQTGVPALALDVWLSYELRRAGFGYDQVWPRPSHPRILPAAAASLIASLPRKLKEEVAAHVANRASIPGVTLASASILGKNYFKQVDVVITDWRTGPELLVSTKRMDSSYGKNAPNRVEESYGDAKNLRLRHPLAALGFVLGLRSDILHKEARAAAWLFDLLAKLGQEDDAYHATCLILMDYDDASAPADSDAEPPPEGIIEPDLEAQDDADSEIPADLPESAIAKIIGGLPRVAIVENQTPAVLSPARFLAAMVTRVLAASPVNIHEEARRRRVEVGRSDATAP